MSGSLSIALTADLHWGHGRGGDATRLLADFLRASPPDVLALAGDLGTGTHFGECLALFADLPSRKALVPGNHDIWVMAEDAATDSLALYERELPAIAAAHGFHYLDAGPLVLPEASLALVGSINWYDYSWGLEGIRRLYPTEEWRLQAKRFPRGRHNDGVYIRWPLDDVAFTARATATLDAQLRAALQQVGHALVVTHHPPFYALSFPRFGPPEALERFLWDGFAGNKRMEDILTAHADRVAFAFCGHTHRQREGTLGGIRGYNIGSDYGYKRLLWLEWPEGTVVAHTFGKPAG
jgi:predicted phosphohydrolase